MSSYLTRGQVEQLLRPINPKRVHKDDKGFAHLAAYDVRDHLSRIFGFGRWSADTEAMEVAFETETAGDKTRWTVCYRAAVKLTICAPDGTRLATYTEWATGTSQNQPSRGDAHEMAAKTAESQALKRCAVNLGNQFGSSLYAKGSLAPTVVRTLVMPPPDAEQEPAPEPVDEPAPPVVAESEQVPAREDNHSQSAAPTPEQPPALDEIDARALRVADLTAQLLAAQKRAEVGGIAGQIGKEKLGAALTYDADDNALTLNALLDAALKRVTRSAA